MKKSFLVTGGTGFIGSNIVKSLIKNHKIKILDNNYRGSFKNIEKLGKKITFIKGDIRNKRILKKASENCNAIIHLAYINGTKNFYKYPVDVLDIAVKGLVNIFDVCLENNIKELYLFSSSEVYHLPSKIPTDEKAELKIPDIYNPRYSYSGGKILTELMGIHYGKKFFKKLVIIRPHNIYGENMGYEHVIPEFIKRMNKIKNKQFLIKGSGKEIRSFMYISDFVKVFELILQKGKHLEIYNIGNCEPISISSLAKKVSRIMNKKIIIKKSPLAKGSSIIRCPDINKIKKMGYKRLISLEEGIKRCINYYIRN